MKLTDIQTFVVGNPPPHFGGRYFVFVKLTRPAGFRAWVRPIACRSSRIWWPG